MPAAVFRRHFQDGIPMQIESHVIDAAQEAGLERDEVAAAVRAPEIKQALRDTTEAASELGVFGVPTLELGGELFWGLDAMPLARAVLADPGLLARGEMGRLPTLGQAQRSRMPA